VSKSYIFEYIDDEGNFVVTLPSGAKSSSKTDHLGRKEYEELQLGTGVISSKFNYAKGSYDRAVYSGRIKSTPETNLVSSISYSNGIELSYKYDISGNIREIRQGNILKAKYVYDGVGRLSEEWNSDTSEIVLYTYDAGGNMVSKKSKFYYGQEDQSIDSFADKGEKTLTYGDNVWKDRLTGYSGFESNIEYDTVGNPLKYNKYRFIWEKGRQLKEIRDRTTDTLMYSFEYNASGIRTKKINHTGTSVKEHSCFLDGTNIIREEIKQSGNTTTVDYLYNKDNAVCGMTYDGTTYYYIKNLQGDVTALTNSDGNIVASYYYDSWGKLYGVIGDPDKAILNPFRYRGYYYDDEFNFYYLNSRYYDPEICRFVNADEAKNIFFDNLLSTRNLYNYCTNDPINNSDQNGKWLIRVASGIVVGALFAGFAYALLDILSDFIKIPQKRKR